MSGSCYMLDTGPGFRVAVNEPFKLIIAMTLFDKSYLTSVIHSNSACTLYRFFPDIAT